MGATEADLKAYVAGSGRDWNQLCQALMWNYCDQFGLVRTTYASALDAYYASAIESYDAYSAPLGAFVYYDIGAYGHVGYEVGSGDSMGSSRVQIVWGINAGVSSIEAYVAATGATPLGWSWRNGVNELEYIGGAKPPETETGEDEEMALRQMHYVESGKTYRGLWSETGYFTRWQDNGSDIANGMSKYWLTNSSVAVSKGLFDYIERDCKLVREGGTG
jgi:hypothetical protein